RRSGTFEQRDGTPVRKRGAGDEVHEHLRRDLIEADQRDRLAAADHQPRDPQRPQPAIILGNFEKLENRVGHEPSRRFTSSTTRADSARAVISARRAARLKATAPYAMKACTIGGRTPVSTLAPMIAATIVTAIASVATVKTGRRAAAM